MKEDKVIATMCMMPGRYPESLKTIDSLEGQVDKLYLCLNGFEYIPDSLKQSWIKVLHLGENLGDASRFYLLRYTGDIDSHVVSCDDDIVYPKTYVKDFLIEHEKNPENVLCHHGDNIVVQNGSLSLNSRLRIRFENKNYQYNVMVPGSGSVFIPKDIFNKLEFNSLVHLNQSDLHLSANFLKLGVKVTGLPHSKDYVDYFHPADGFTIWDEITSKPDWYLKVIRIMNSYKIQITDSSKNT
jgi:hypothetical protein